jgi:hypothetical protein
VAGYVKRLPYTEKLIIEIFGAYIFERDLAQPGYKLINACKLAVPPICRSMFFKLVNPLGKGNYAKLANWLFTDLVMLRVNNANIKKFDRFTEEQIIGFIREYEPTGQELKDFALLTTVIPDIVVPGFNRDMASVAAYLAILDGAISKTQVDWLNLYQFPIKNQAVNLRPPG